MKHGFAIRSVASPHGLVQVLHFVLVLRVLLGNRMFLLNCCLRHTSSVSQARHLLPKEKAILTVSNVFSAGEHSSPLTVFNLHNCFACGTPRTSSPTNELKAFCYTVSSILVLAPTRQSSGSFQKGPITAANCRWHTWKRQIYCGLLWFRRQTKAPAF